MSRYLVIGSNCDGDRVEWECDRGCDAAACLAMLWHFGGSGRAINLLEGEA